MTDGTQTEPKAIAEVFLSIEARQFWERVYCTLIAVGDAKKIGYPLHELADNALAAWRERFEPKAGE